MEEKKTGDLELQEKDLKKAALLFWSANKPVCQQILQFLSTKDRAAVTELYRSLRLEQSLASQHLGILRRAGLVEARRSGKQIFYSLHEEKLKALHSAAAALLKTNDYATESKEANDRKLRKAANE